MPRTRRTHCHSALVLAVACLAATCHRGYAAPGDLVGEWTTTKVDEDGQYDAHMVLDEGGAAQLEGRIAYSEEAAEELDTTDIDGFSLFPSGLIVSFAGTGEWRADDDSLHIDTGEVTLRLNGMETVEWVEDAGRRLANVLADALGLPAEGREGFEANTIAALKLQLDPEELASLATRSFELAKGYSVDGNALTLRDADGTSKWERKGVVSAVERVTWGAVKAGYGG